MQHVGKTCCRLEEERLGDSFRCFVCCLFECWYSFQGNTLSEFSQQNLATPEFLVKCLLLTASFLNGRKQCEYGTHTENTIH